MVNDSDFDYVELSKETIPQENVKPDRKCKIEIDEASELKTKDELKQIFLEKVSNVDQSIIRKRISKWASSIPHHEFKDLGEKIGIAQITEMPTYVISLKTLYESRKLKNDSFPYTGKRKIEPKSISEEDINVWSTDLGEAPDDFMDDENKYIIKGTQEIERCAECRGTGDVTCPKCDGRRKIECRDCRGRGKIECSKCDATGRIKCWSCRGKGFKEKSVYSGGHTRTIEEKCSSCRGKGYEECPKCQDGYITCRRCGGDGWVTCNECDGTGLVTCSNCEGYKEMVNFLYIEHFYKVNPISIFKKNTLENK